MGIVSKKKKKKKKKKELVLIEADSLVVDSNLGGLLHLGSKQEDTEYVRNG